MFFLYCEFIIKCIVNAIKKNKQEKVKLSKQEKADAFLATGKEIEQLKAKLFNDDLSDSAVINIDDQYGKKLFDLK